MARFDTVVVIVLDSVGCGEAPDAAAFGDAGANTLGHVIGKAGASLPNLAALGLGAVPGVHGLPGFAGGTYDVLAERGPGKDTMLGHWELMGVVAESNFPLYPQGFPAAVIDEFERRTGMRPIGNCAASGTEIIDRLGDEHLRCGMPILYTSGDSVFQLAAHEDVVAPSRLYEICQQARQMLQGEHGVGRVIARPFRGDTAGGFRRTAGRRDFPMPPPRPTALDYLRDAGVAVHAVGKIHDIFAGRGISSWEKSADNEAGVAATLRAMRERAAPLIVTNLVDFDSEYGHRNDASGYARALEEFDVEVPRLLQAVPEGGLLILTADHGNDPTWPGTDHTRERVPLLVAPGRPGGANLGEREFADLGATLLHNFEVAGELDGASFLELL